MKYYKIKSYDSSIIKNKILSMYHEEDDNDIVVRVSGDWHNTKGPAWIDSHNNKEYWLNNIFVGYDRQREFGEYNIFKSNKEFSKYVKLLAFL